MGNFSIIIVYETFDIFRLYFSIQNSSHFSMLGLGDIVSKYKEIQKCTLGKGYLKIEFHEFRWYELIHTEKTPDLFM